MRGSGFLIHQVLTYGGLGYKGHENVFKKILRRQLWLSQTPNYLCKSPAFLQMPNIFANAQHFLQTPNFFCKRPSLLSNAQLYLQTPSFIFCKRPAFFFVNAQLFLFANAQLCLQTPNFVFKRPTLFTNAQHFLQTPNIFCKRTVIFANA